MRQNTGVAIRMSPDLSLCPIRQALLPPMTSSLNCLFSNHLGDDLQLIFISPRKY